MNKDQKGFGIVEIIIVLVILAVVAGVGWKVFSSDKNQPADNSANEAQDDQPMTNQEQPIDGGSFAWQQTVDGWKSIKTPPTCPDQPMLSPPADMSKVSSILYPGQSRGGNYKPHGGFRFDNSNNDIAVVSPVDGFLVRGSRYLAEGEVQYTVDIFHNCGVMIRLGHIRELSEKLSKIADTWPQPTESSATHGVNPPVQIKKGESLGTKVGIIKGRNVFFDLGVYDYRQQNSASNVAAFRSAHSSDKELSWYAVCWLKGWLPKDTEDRLNSLPAADPKSGKTSDYCSG